jgi:hypothetical protein
MTNEQMDMLNRLAGGDDIDRVQHIYLYAITQLNIASERVARWEPRWENMPT